MAASRFTINKRVTGATGAPAQLLSAELAYNMVDGKLYIGYGDDGSGNATSVKAVAGDDFSANLPSGGANGQILGYAAGKPVWQTAPEGALYTAGSGLNLNGTAFSVDTATIATIASVTAQLANYVTSSALTSALSGKANTSHGHSAADITSGTLDPARLPTSVFQAPIVAASNIASLTGSQQSDIRAGSTVVTSDGRSWMYTGTGSKTVEASYREMADSTPEWSVIANKPVFSAVATSGAYGDLTGRPTISTVGSSGSYNDLSNRPTLGTMAAQNASAVAITGGSISGIVFDGGTF
jgi:hypothetical protein